MKVVKVSLLKKESYRATRVAMVSQKQATDLDISALPPSAAADNFLMHLRGWSGGLQSP